MVGRRGTSTLGCLLPLLAIAVGLYLARGFAEAYFREYQFADAMKQEARFTSTRSDAMITAHLRSLADSLGLPRDAGRVQISHGAFGVTIWSDYEETIKLPFDHEKTIYFHPSSGKGF